MTDNGAVAYERDVLENFDPRRKPTYPKVTAVPGLVVEDRSSGFCGDVVKATFEAVTLRDRKGQLRHFTWKDGGFLVEGKRVTLVREEAAKPTGPRFTASGSVASDRPVAARVARASRIWVEGRHDAELLEHVWGDDLRELGIVVEPMHGIDHLEEAVREFGPSPERRLGILVDHLVEGGLCILYRSFQFRNRGILLCGIRNFAFDFVRRVANGFDGLGQTTRHFRNALGPQYKQGHQEHYR